MASLQGDQGAHPDARILMLYNGYDPTNAEVNGRLENVHSPEALLDTVQLLISKPESALDLKARGQRADG